MKADDLILFSAVVELGSFSKVADRYNLTNSVVSKHIKHLEEELGVQLLYRTTRKLSLTEAGRVLLTGAQNVRAATQEAINSVAGYEEKVTGHIKMSVPTISGELLLADAIAEFCQMNPGLTVEMSLNNKIIDLIEEGYDLAIRTNTLDDSSLIARHILDSQWVVCASPAYLSHVGTPAEPQALINHNCLLYTGQKTGANEWEFTDQQKHYFIKVSGNLSTDNAVALRKAVLGGYGIAYVPRCLVYTDLQQSLLIELFPQQAGKKLGVYAVYPFTRQPQNKVRLLIEHIRTRYLNIAHYFQSTKR